MDYYYDHKHTRHGMYFGRVYHYDSTGNKEIVIHKTKEVNTPEDAEDAAVLWCEENNIDASLGG